MSKRMPPVPPAGRSPRGGGAAPETQSDVPAESSRAVPQNLKEQGRQANIRQNTRNTGYQQDR